MYVLHYPFTSNYTEFIDYVPLIFRKSFDVGDPPFKCVLISLFNDSIVEETEFFTVSLSGSADVTTEPVNASSTVFITDANGKYVLVVMIMDRLATCTFDL